MRNKEIPVRDAAYTINVTADHKATSRSVDASQLGHVYNIVTGRDVKGFSVFPIFYQLRIIPISII
ncbi:hypothetical protein ASV10_01955 [Enterobacter hormaechei subsp. xiangfangensis]|nr:hypothetical protein ASV10_01955 [Enterobacter hormaechei subsp. xiangfangensis]KTJ14973.1 hypothetical protein ASU90_03550 [Enterobacter hormaechei subsp. xiangfangensis]